jgi:LacI family transcriptional regulator
MSGGILHYAAVHENVQVRLYGEGAPWRRLEDFGEWRPDGVIIGAADAATVGAVESLGCRAAVFVNTAPCVRTHLKYASVYCDNRAVAEAAVEVFRSKKIGHLAFVGVRSGESWSVERGENLRRIASEENSTFSEFVSNVPVRAGHRREIAALAKWIAALPKPCGIFAACDARAKDVFDAAADAGVSIPEQILVLGVDNEEFICRQTVPSLSSVIPDFARGGYIAAETLVNLIRGGKARPNGTFGVKGVVERLSTCDVNGASRMVLRAKDFIRNHAGAIGSVEEVAKASGSSLRLLQKNFKTITGVTLSEAIQARRLRLVCDMLRESATPISRIGEMCGFGNEGNLKKVFRRHFGCTMREYRRNPPLPWTFSAPASSK